MFRTIVTTTIFLAIALGGGIASVWYALDSNRSFGSIKIGNWIAYPEAGTPNADPYSVARRARDGELPLGQAEGLRFYAKIDSEGKSLSGRCNYTLEGNVPQARFWTLYAAGPGLAAIRSTAHRNTALHSRQLLRRQDSSFAITIGPDPAPGNWISVSVPGPVVFVLTLYDTQVASAVTSAGHDFPGIVRADCRDG